MDEVSESESQGRNSKVDEDGSTIPSIITEEYFEEIAIKCRAMVRSLLTNLNTVAADEMQTMLTVAEHLRSNLENEMERVKQAQKQYDELLARYDETVKLWATDKEKIRKQRDEIDQAWRERDAALLRDQMAQTQMYSMREKLEAVESAVKNVNKNTRDELGMSLTKQKESLMRDRDRLAAEVDDLNKKLQQQRLQTEAVEKRRAEHEEKCRELYKMLDEASTEAFKEKRALDQMRVSLNDITIERNSLSEQLKFFQSQSETFQANNVQLNLKIGAIKANLLRMTSQYNVCNGKLTKAISDLDETTSKCDQLQIDLFHQQNTAKQREAELGRIVRENGQMMKTRDAIQKRIQTLETEKTELVKEVTKLSNSIIMLEKQHEINQKAFDKVQKLSDEVLRERDAIHKELKKMEKIVETQLGVIKLHEQQCQSLESQVKTLTTAIEVNKKNFNNLKRERDRNVSNSLAKNDKMDATQSELTIKMKEIVDLTWDLNQTRTKLTHTQQQLETETAERIAMQKNLDTITDDRNDVREKLRIAIAEQNKLKQTISAKNTENVRAQKQIDRIEKEKSTLKIELQNATVSCQHIRTELAEREHECRSLYRALADEEKKCTQMEKKVDAIQNEKDHIGAELVKKTDENRVWEEKREVMKVALDRGERHYIERLEDIRLLKIEIKNLRHRNRLLTHGICNTIDMRQEVLQLHRELNQERVKCRALEDELSTPLNIHRWRKLSGKDPEKMDLVVKIQTLQKRILFQTAVAVEKENALRQSNILYNALKSAMEQFSNVDKIKQQLCYTRRALTAKTRKIKALSAESNIKDEEIKLKDTNLKQLREDLMNKKQHLLYEKRDKQKLKTQLDVIKTQINNGFLERPLSNPVQKTAGFSNSQHDQ